MAVEPLISTRIRIPPLRADHVSRPRLVSQLNEGLQLGHRLSLIAAPAGFGKTTLIGDWISNCDWPVSWLTVDESCNDFSVFITYLIISLRQVDDRFGQLVRPLLQAQQSVMSQDLITALINELINTESNLIVVLDDYHLITSFSIHDALSFLVDNQPSGFHIAIGTREDPPLPLSRLRARGLITEIRERSLRFTRGESATFLNGTMKLNLGSENVEILETRTEGWVTGLQLAGLALRSEGNADNFIASFAGDDRFIMEYLLTEVIEGQPDQVNHFLRCTSILNRLIAPLCNALTGDQNGQEILEHLENANLFLIPLDRRREWFRYHQLFAEVLRLTLTKQELIDLHGRASQWYEMHDHMDQAVHHALAKARLGGNLDDAEQLIAKAALEGIFTSSNVTVRGWFEALPDARVRSNPALALSKGWMLALSGGIKRSEEYLEAAESAQKNPSSPEGGMILVLRCFITLLNYRDYPKTIAMVSDALDLLTEEMTIWRLIALWARAEAEERSQPIPRAIDSFKKAQEFGRSLPDKSFTVTVDMALSAALNTHGKRRDALTSSQAALVRYKDIHGRESKQSALLMSQIGKLYHEANQLKQAHQYLEKGLAYSRQLGEAGYLLPSQAFFALTLAAMGDVEQAIDLLRSAYRLAVQTGFTDPVWYLAQIANIDLQRGILLPAVQWSEEAGLQPDDDIDFLKLESQIVYSRILLKQQRLEDAQLLLSNIEKFVRERELHRYLLTTYLIQALVSRQKGDDKQKIGWIAQAVSIAAPEEYYRAFLDEDLTIDDLTSEVRQENPRFIDYLVAYMRAPAQKNAIPSQPLIEPLSERELEVLGLINQGYSNADIAQQLYIAIGTVKRHINNIYGKLDVKSRTQAIVKVRDLHLLD